MSHRLELALKDSLNDFIKPLDDSLRHLYYLYKNSSKNIRKLKALYKVFEETYTFKNIALRPEKASGTCWINHKLRAMAKLNNKFGVYMAHLENVIADTSKKTDRATLQGKFTLLSKANVI